MRYSIVLASLAAISAAMPALPAKRAAQITGKPYQITNLAVADVTNGTTALTFNLYDPEPNSQARAVCSGSWTHGFNDYPSDTYKQCGNSTLAWNIASWDSAQSFVLGLESLFTDPSLGQPPYDQAITFARAIINTSSVDYATTSVSLSGAQKQNVTILAKIYAITA